MKSIYITDETYEQVKKYAEDACDGSVTIGAGVLLSIGLSSIQKLKETILTTEQLKWQNKSAERKLMKLEERYGHES